MAVRLNRHAFEHTKDLIAKGMFVADQKDAWSEHQPSAADENDFIRTHDYNEFGKWHLGPNDEKDPQTRGRYEFPYGDFVDVHRCAVLSTESRAGHYKHFIENDAAHLHGVIDASQH